MAMTQEERVAADARVRGMLGVNRKGTGPDAPRMPARPGSALAVTAGTKLPIDDEVYAIQMYGYGEIWGRPGLELRDRSFMTLALLTASSQQDQLAIHVNNALNLGLTPDEIAELLMHVGIYSGVPTWHNATNVARWVFIERGVLEPGPGVALIPLAPTDRPARQRAAEQVKQALGIGRIGLGENALPLAELPAGPAATTSSDTLAVEEEIAQIQDEYAYGDIWSRPGLDTRTRAIVTVAVLQLLRLNDQLHAYINVALNVGVTPEELHEVFAHAGVYSGIAGWQNAVNVARDVFIQRGVLKG